jgi:hypothetical protein
MSAVVGRYRHPATVRRPGDVGPMANLARPDILLVTDSGHGQNDLAGCPACFAGSLCSAGLDKWEDGV